MYAWAKGSREAKKVRGQFEGFAEFSLSGGGGEAWDSADCGGGGGWLCKSGKREREEWTWKVRVGTDFGSFEGQVKKVLPKGSGEIMESL